MANKFSDRTRIVEGNGNILGTPSNAVAALVGHFPAIATSSTAAGLDNDTPVKLRSLREAELLGFSKDLDKTEGALFHYHIKQFFEQHENGTLWISTANPVLSWEKLVKSGNMDYLEKLLTIAAQDTPVRYVGVIFNPDSNYSPSTQNELDSQVWIVLEELHATATAFYENHIPFVAVVEGRSFGKVSNALDLSTLGYDRIAVCVGADYTPDFRTYLNGITNDNVLYHAAVGTALGVLSKTPVNVSMGYVSAYDIQNTIDGRFLAVGLSSGLPINDGLTVNYTDEDLWLLDQKKYIFMYKDVDSPGTYISDSWNCTDPNKTDYSNLELRRTMDEALIRGRKAIRPLQNMTVRYNADGTLEDGTLAFVKGVVEKPLADMVKEKLISFFDVKIPPNQNVKRDGLTIQRAIRPDETARTITDTANYRI